MKHVKNYTDAELIEAVAPARATEELPSATRFLFRQYFEPFRTYIIRNQGTHQDAETIFGEVVATFIELVRLHKLPARTPVKTFLYALNRQLWLDELNRRGRTLATEKPYAEAAMDEPLPDFSAIVAGRPIRQQAQEAVERLDDTSRKILLAFYYDHVPLGQIRKIGRYQNDRSASLKKDKALKQLEQMLTANPGIAQKLKRALHYER